MKTTIEIRPAEGGEDSRLLVADLAQAYMALAHRHAWKAVRLALGTGEQVIITGEGLEGLASEAGGHRFQRVPPTERKGRVHTSTVTVAVLNEVHLGAMAGPWTQRRDQDFRAEWFSGSGAGGQHRNKHQNCCRYIHIPTGTVVKVEGRERTKNLIYAKAEMKKRLDSMGSLEYIGRLGQIRKDQVGSGMRGDKVRTIRMQADEAIDHRTGKRIRASDYLEGKMDKLW